MTPLIGWIGWVLAFFGMANAILGWKHAAFMRSAWREAQDGWRESATAGVECAHYALNVTMLAEALTRHVRSDVAVMLWRQHLKVSRVEHDA